MMARSCSEPHAHGDAREPQPAWSSRSSTNRSRSELDARFAERGDQSRASMRLAMVSPMTSDAAGGRRRRVEHVRRPRAGLAEHEVVVQRAVAYESPGARTPAGYGSRGRVRRCRGHARHGSRGSARLARASGAPRPTRPASTRCAIRPTPRGTRPGGQLRGVDRPPRFALPPEREHRVGPDVHARPSIPRDTWTPRNGRSGSGTGYISVRRVAAARHQLVVLAAEGHDPQVVAPAVGRRDLVGVQTRAIHERVS